MQERENQGLVTYRAVGRMQQTLVSYLSPGFFICKVGILIYTYRNAEERKQKYEVTAYYRCDCWLLWFHQCDKSLDYCKLSKRKKHSMK